MGDEEGTQEGERLQGAENKDQEGEATDWDGCLRSVSELESDISDNCESG